MPGLILYLAGSAVLGMGLCFAGKRHYPLLLGILTFFSVCSARAAVDGAMGAGTLLAALAAGALTGLCARWQRRRTDISPRRKIKAVPLKKRHGL